MKQINRITIATLIFVAFFAEMVYAQPKILKKENQIIFQPGIKPGTILKYKITSQRMTQSEEDSAQSSSNSYVMEMQFISLNKEKARFRLGFSESPDTLLNQLMEGAYASVIFNFENGESTVERKEQFAQAITDNADRILSQNSIDSTASIRLADMALKLSDHASIDDLSYEIQYVMNFYHRTYPYETVVSDSVEVKDLLGDPAYSRISYGVSRKKKAYILRFAKTRDTTGDMQKMMSQALEEKFGEGAEIISTDNHYTQDQPGEYTRYDVTFDKKTGIIQSFIRDEQKSVFSLLINSKKSLQLITD